MIFLELHKEYAALDRDRCLEILEGHRVGPRYCRLLHTHWDRLKTVARLGRYYGTAFRCFWGMTQWDPLTPTIFNVVVDTVVCHWISLVAEGEDGPEERGGR